MEYLQLFWIFFKAGAFTIGGGYAMIPLITKEMASVFPEMTKAVQDCIGIAEITPGPFGINCATFVGMLVGGVPGALLATLGVISPALIITTIVARFFNALREKKPIKRALYGMRPAVLGLIAGLVVTMLPDAFMLSGTAALNTRAIFICLLCLYSILKLKIPPELTVLASAALGLLLFAL